MAFPESLHPDDALVGFTLGALACGAVLLSSVLAARSTSPGAGPGTRKPERYAVAWGAGAALTASVVAIGEGLLTDVSFGAALATLVVAALAGAGWHRSADQLTARWPTVVVLVSAVGIWLAVPDTEAAVTVLGALAPFAVIGVARGARLSVRTPPLAWFALAVAVTWTAAWGASGRIASLPGALACCGVALVIPFVWVIAPRAALDVRWLVPLHAAAVVVSARWAARAPSIGQGLLRSSVVLAAVAVVTAISSRRASPAYPPPCDPVERPG